jgi:WD40 repeat protein
VQVSKGRVNEPGSVKIFDLATNKIAGEFASGGDYPFLTPKFSTDGRWLAVGDYNEQITLWDVENRKVARQHRCKGMAFSLGLAFSNDGRWLAVPARVKTDADRERDPDPRDTPQPRVFLFDLTKGANPEELVCPHGWAGGIAFSADSKTLAFGSAGAAHLFDVSKPSP